METKNCQNCKQDFNIEVDDKSFYRIIKVPSPTWCPICRLKRRLIWRNERTLYKRVCDLCNKPNIGMYHPEYPFLVYCRECWYSDNWDPFSFAQEYDFSKPFFEQWKELLQKVPRCNMAGTKNVNSEYTNFSFSNSNSYLCFASHYNEDSAYLQYSNRCKSTFDCLHVGNSERSVDCNYAEHLNGCVGLLYADSCTECTLGYDLHNCMNCFGCVGLRGKSYMIFNEQYDKQSYLEKVVALTSNREAFEEARKQFEKLKAASPVRGSYQRKCVESTGSDLEECKNVKDSFSVKRSEDSRYLFVNCIQVKSSMDMNNIASEPTEFTYEAQGVTGTSNSKCIDTTWDSSYIEYSNLCFSSNNLFGCIGLRKKEYCILNKQYDKETYQELIEKIKEHMVDMPYSDKEGHLYSYGEFFPTEFSPFKYNETILGIYFPLTKGEILEKNYTFREQEERTYTATKTIETLPDSPEGYTTELAHEIIECTHKGLCSDQCTKAFRVLPEEIALYKSLRIPLPTECPNCRNMSRIKARGEMMLRKTTCQCAHTEHEHTAPCGKEVLTNLPSGKQALFYCDTCYQLEVV